MSPKIKDCVRSHQVREPPETPGNRTRDNRPVTRDRSLEELEDDHWPAPAADATRLVTSVHALRRRPVGSPAAEDLRLLIRQDVGLPHLLPLALEALRDDPLTEGDMYEGDLLSAVVTRDPSAWGASPGLLRELHAIVSQVSGLPPALQQEVDGFLGSVSRP